MMDFPSNPVPGQKFNPGTGSIYTWDGVAWNLAPVNVATARSRNRVNNPTMQMSQENGTTAVTGNSTYPADMWALWNNMTGVTVSAQRVTLPTPSPEGTTIGIAITSTAAKASLAASDVLAIRTVIEGVDVADLGWGTAKAQPIVLRFCAICDTAGTYGFQFGNADNSRNYCGSFTITQAGVPQVFSFAVPGDTSGTWLKDNGAGIFIGFGYAVGTQYVGVAGWQAGLKINPPGCSNGAAIANAKLYITDVGGYADPDNTGVAPSWTPPSYVDDLAKCQRYYEICAYTVVGYAGAASVFLASRVYYKVNKRTAPTVSGAGGGTNLTFNSYQQSTFEGVSPFMASAGVGGCDARANVVANARLI